MGAVRIPGGPLLPALVLAGGSALIGAPAAGAEPAGQPVVHCNAGASVPTVRDGVITAESWGYCSGGYARVTTTLTLHRLDGSIVGTREGTATVLADKERIAEITAPDCVSGFYYADGSAEIAYPLGHTPAVTTNRFASGLAYLTCD